MEYFGGLGHSGDQVWNQTANKKFPVEKINIFGGCFDIFSVFVASVFQCIFRDAPFRHCGRFGNPKVAKMKVLGGRFAAILGTWPTCENRGFM